MKVIRYTIDVCARGSVDKDVYGLASSLEKAIMGCEGVCGCEVAWKNIPGFSSVDVNAALQWQSRNKQWLEVEK